jgi:hypothetical protein
MMLRELVAFQGGSRSNRKTSFENIGQSDARAGGHLAGTLVRKTTAALLDFIIVTITHQNSFGEKKMATTTLRTSSLRREFVFNGSRIPDPDPQMSID